MLLKWLDQHLKNLFDIWRELHPSKITLELTIAFSIKRSVKLKKQIAVDLRKKKRNC